MGFAKINLEGFYLVIIKILDQIKYLKNYATSNDDNPYSKQLKNSVKNVQKVMR